MNKKKKYLNNNNSINYKGKVSIQLMKGKQVAAKKVFYNNGNLPLFQLLANCTAGDYSDVESLRPKFIKIFKIGQKGSQVPSFNSFNELVGANDTSLASLSYPLYSAEPNIILSNPSSSDKFGRASVTFKFIVPFTQLSFYDDLNMIALYPQKYVGVKDNACAFIVITKKDDPDILSDIISDSGLGSDDYELYNLFIEWTMTFKNEGE